MESRLLTMLSQIIEAAGEHEAGTMASEFHLRLEHPCFPPLEIASYPAPFRYIGEKRWVHYCQMQKDGTPDRDVVITYPWGIPIACQEPLAYTCILDVGTDGTTTIQRDAFARVLALMDTWATSLEQQGWLTIATAYGEKQHCER